jgi:signal transduction histidine kinase
MCHPTNHEADFFEQNSMLEFAHLLEDLPTPAYLCAPDGLITHFNQHALRLWARDPSLSNPAGRFCGSLQIFSTDGSPIAHEECFMAVALDTGIECSGKEIMIQCANGQHIAVLAHAKPLHDQSGKLKGAVGILVDLSAQNQETHSLQNELLKCRKLEQKFFEYSERKQSRLTYHLHEDLGQQLTGIGLLVRVLGRRLSEESHAELDNVIELANLVSETISTARNLAKSSYPLELDHGDLMMALEDLVRRTSFLFKISCRLVYDDSFQYEHDAGIHLFRIAQELIDNAITYACARDIVVECKARDGVEAMAVTNNGIPFKYLLGKSNGMDLDLIHARARLFGAHLEIQESEVGGTVICWLDNGPTKHTPPQTLV